ncbi:histidine kinase [Sphingobacterium sp. lm-10]|uniref:sensor histidine kinase n=1 Tax=Sphingobacterium sp. lm-10 TaxID=2944904 RepID=UPI00202053A8|nr:histidine kinase [Sphingobacterium sp. lm-10]MCL7986649.1 histidine kinase [Sphingobacterium sp. lm-10]
MKLSLRKNWSLELLIFCSMLIITMLQEWIYINSIEDFFKGFVFFLILYLQAQVHRFVVFRYYLLKKYFIYIVYSLVLILVGAIILLVADMKWIDPDFYDSGELAIGFLYNLFICIISTATVMAISLMKGYANEVQRAQLNQILFNEMNLKFLHAQLNPHFFFNMLHNLYGVSLTEPKRTPELIIKVSELMRYQIENGNTSKVSLSNEINFIRNYVDLERERIGKRCNIIFRCSHSTNEIEYLKISPLLLIILVENSFKHSCNQTFWFVHISIELKGNVLRMIIINSIGDEDFKEQSTHLGLDNLKQRLSYVYNDDFILESHKLASHYKTILVLNLDN